MNPDSSELNNPKTTVDLLLLETLHHLFGEGSECADKRLSVRSQHNNAGGRFWWEAQDVAKVEIERDEASLFSTADIINHLIGCTVKFLIVNGRNIITGLAQNPGNTKPEILVELEFHADFSIGSGT